MAVKMMPKSRHIFTAFRALHYLSLFCFAFILKPSSYLHSTYTGPFGFNTASSFSSQGFSVYLLYFLLKTLAPKFFPCLVPDLFKQIYTYTHTHTINIYIYIYHPDHPINLKTTINQPHSHSITSLCFTSLSHTHEIILFVYLFRI